MVEDLIVLTGASGKICSHVIPLVLLKHPRRLRLVANSTASLERLKSQYPQAEVEQADLTLPNEARRVLKGATSLYHVGPPFHPHETEIGYNVVDAAVGEARDGAFKHFVYSGVIQSQLRKLLNHDCKRFVEEYLMESGLNWTILQPTHFLDEARFLPLMHQDKPTYFAGFDSEVCFSFITHKDYGEASAKILVEREEHYFAQYPLVSTLPLPYSKVLGEWSRILGKEIAIVTPPLEKAVVGLLRAVFGMEDVPMATREAAERMLLYYNRRGPAGNPRILEGVLGKKPTSVRDFLQSLVQSVGEGS